MGKWVKGYYSIFMKCHLGMVNDSFVGWYGDIGSVYIGTILHTGLQS